MDLWGRRDNSHDDDNDDDNDDDVDDELAPKWEDLTCLYTGRWLMATEFAGRGRTPGHSNAKIVQK